MILLDTSLTANTQYGSPVTSEFKPDDSSGLCARLNDKWTVLVLWRVASAAGGRIRFSMLKKEIKGVTQRMLTLTLRGLQRDGLVRRHIFPEVPPRVEYELTELGAGMLEALRPINRWIATNLSEIEQCRQRYDAFER